MASNMFEKLISLNSPIAHQGIIWSLEGGHYLAIEVDRNGNPVKQAQEVFKSSTLAKAWLNKHGVHTIFMRQSPAYFEMIGHSA